MTSAEYSVIIKRSLTEVFSYIANGENNKAWRSATKDIHRKSGSGNVGTIYEQGVTGPGGRRIPADYEIVTFEENSKLGFRVIAGPARPNGEYIFSEDAEGTHVHFRLWWEPKGLLQKLMSFMVQKTMQVEVKALDSLKRVLEQ